MALGVSLYLGHSCTLFVYTRRTQSWHPPHPQLSGFRCLLVSRAQLYIFCLYKRKIKLVDPLLPPTPQVTLWGQRFKLYYQLVPMSPSPLPAMSFFGKQRRQQRSVPQVQWIFRSQIEWRDTWNVRQRRHGSSCGMEHLDNSSSR